MARILGFKGIKKSLIIKDKIFKKYFYDSLKLSFFIETNGRVNFES